MSVHFLQVDTSNKRKSLALVNGKQVSFWGELIDLYGEEQVSISLLANALREEGKHDDVLALVSPYFSGENTYRIEHYEQDDGSYISAETGADTRSYLKKWYDAYYG